MHDTQENDNANLEARQQKEGEGSTQAHISERVPKRVRLGNDADLDETRRDLLLAEGGTDSDGEVARGIQHGAAALGAGLQATGATSHHPKTGAWRCGKQNPFPTSPHPRRLRRTKIKRGVTLTFHLVQKIGPVRPTGIPFERAGSQPNIEMPP